MTKITFFKRNGVYHGFRESGHSGFADAGQDIVCAAISAMTMLIINTIEISYACNVEYTIDEDSADVVVNVPSALKEFEADDKKRFAVNGLIQGYFFQLMDMTEDYPEFLEVEEIDS